jgi:hypothetical protein
MIHMKAVQTKATSETGENTFERLKQALKPKLSSNRIFVNVAQTFLSAVSGDVPVASSETGLRDRNVQ